MGAGVGPTCVVNGQGEVRGVDWQFNAWGGDYDGLYAHWEKDNAAAARSAMPSGWAATTPGISCWRAAPSTPTARAR